MSSQQKNKFFKDVKPYSGTTPFIQGSVAEPRNSALCFREELLNSLKVATVDPPGDTTVPITPLKRSSIQDFIGPQSTRMPTTMSPDVTFVNVKAKFRNVMTCHKTLSKFVKSLTFEALILWGRSRLQEGTNIYSWQLITYRNGLKRKRSPPMMPELFANFLKLSSLDLVPLMQS
ncbi:hypothetical protein Tco_1283486 [Tanacetum coccineum]